MFRKVVNRLGVGALLVASVTVMATASGGSAGLSLVTATPFYSHDRATPPNGPNNCPGAGINERHYCLVVTTYNNLAQNGGVEVDLTLQNYDQSSLTNPTASLGWTNGTPTNGANLSFVSSNPSICSAPASGGPVACAFPNLPGLGSAADSSHQEPCGPSGPVCSTVKLYFTAASTVSSVDFNTTADVKESNQQNGANLDEQVVDHALMTFDANNTDASLASDATVALPSKHPLLKAIFGGRPASVTFDAGSSPFLAQFQAGSVSACFPGVACTGLQLATDLSGAPSGTFSASHQILWTADVAATNTNVLAVHYYDPVSIAASPPSTLTTAGTGFASCDGVNFGNTPPAGLAANQDYFVRNATVNGTSTSFQVAATAKGQALSFTGSGSVSGSCIRIIGDQKSEKIGPCTATAAPAAPAQPPALCAVKLSNTTVRVYLWDAANGKISL